jgi:hypothetical protein
MPRAKKEEPPADEVVAEPTSDQAEADQIAYLDYHDAGGPDSHRDRRRE